MPLTAYILPYRCCGKIPLVLKKKIIQGKINHSNINFHFPFLCSHYKRSLWNIWYYTTANNEISSQLINKMHYLIQ